MRGFEQRQRAALRERAFGDHDDAELRAPAVALEQPLRDELDVERNLRNQDRVGAAGHAGVQRDPSRVAPHHFHDEDALVRLGRRVQPVDGIRREIHRGVEPETVRGADDVVVDRLRDADDGNAALAELMSDRESAIAADHDERIEAHLAEHLDAAVGVVARTLGRRDLVRERVAAVDGAEDRPAEAQDARDVAGREEARPIGLDETVEAVFEADALDARICRGLHDRANDGVQAWSVATTRQHTDALDHPTECSRKFSWYNFTFGIPSNGRLAQLGERCVRNAEVGSSNLLPSTSLRSHWILSELRLGKRARS